MDTALDELRETIALRQERALLATEIAYGELTLTVAPGAIPETTTELLESRSRCLKCRRPTVGVAANASLAQEPERPTSIGMRQGAVPATAVLAATISR